MSLSTLAVTFGLIFVAELPDKTMVATIVLASRYRPLPVWAGAAVGMVCNSVVAVAAGRLLELLPHRTVEAVVTAFFAGGALFLLLGRERTAERRGEEGAGKVHSGRRIAMASFGVIVLAEVGDITQILTANLAARYRDPLSVFVGATLALVVVAGIGVVGGRALLRVLPLGTIRRVAGVILAGFAVYNLVSVVRS